MLGLLLTVGLALAGDCPWTGATTVHASMTQVFVGDVAYDVTGPRARKAFHEEMTDCGVSARGHDLFDKWRRRRRTINSLGPVNVVFYIPLTYGAAAAAARGQLVGELMAAAARQGAPPAVAGVAAPAEPTWPSVDLPLKTGARAEGDAAVVIGLEDYAFIADVPYARRDANAFYNFLVYTRGIPMDRVQHLEAGSVEQIRRAVEAAGNQVGEGGTVWVYFAGHGAASPTSREQILLGDDVRADPQAFDARALPVAELETLASAGGGQPLLVLDTCFAGQGRGGDELIAGTRFAVPSYAVASQEAVQWTAAGPNELSGPFDEVEHGAFTYFVVGALRGWADGEISGAPDGVVTGEEAQAYVARALKAVQRRGQTPSWVGADGAAVQLSEAAEPGPDIR